MLPDTKPIEPYLGLFSLVVLNPSRLVGMDLCAQYLPPLSTLKGGRFVRAPERKSALARNVARIFDSVALADEPPDLVGQQGGPIPLSPEQPTFEQVRYWRIPVKMEAVLVALQDRIGRTKYATQEITCTQNIFRILGLQRSYRSISVSIPILKDLWGDDQIGSDISSLSTRPPQPLSEYEEEAGLSGDEQSLGKRKRQQGDDDRGTQKRKSKKKVDDVVIVIEASDLDPGPCRENGGFALF